MWRGLCVVLGLQRVVLATSSILETTKLHERGIFGSSFENKYKSSSVVSPVFDVTTYQQGDNDENNLYTFLGPHGYKVTKPGPTIVTDDGTLIWTTSQYDGVAMNFRVQQYAGKPYLTFWSGDNHIKGHGRGYYYMLDSSYNLYKKFGATNGFEGAGDLHEFVITESGTAIITIYQRIRADFSQLDFSRTDGYIWDSIFQEFDIRNGSLIFEWHASDHYSLKESHKDLNNDGSHGSPWDWAHINSIEKDRQGNYLVSFRNFHGVAHISGSTSKVLWQLGGRGNNFTDLSGGNATNFRFQHNARWTADGITLFDNAVNYDHPHLASYSRGLVLAVDTTAMTVKFVQEYVNPSIAALSQGSMQTLPNGNVLLGYGDIAAFTEFLPSGEIIRDSRFGPVSEFGSDNMQSYRVFKFPWKGYPKTRPAIAVGSNEIYVSWNGATEVKSWCLQDVDDLSDEHGYRDLNCTAKAGFETAILFNEMTIKKYIRVMAFDDEGKALGQTQTFDWEKDKFLIRVVKCCPSQTSLITTVIVFLGFVLVFLAYRAASHWFQPKMPFRFWPFSIFEASSTRYIKLQDLATSGSSN